MICTSMGLFTYEAFVDARALATRAGIDVELFTNFLICVGLPGLLLVVAD